MNARRLYLVQTDTTVGLLSRDALRLNRTKRRPEGQKLICAVAGFRELEHHVRVPKSFRKTVRNAKRTTFAYPGGAALRAVSPSSHLHFLSRFGFLYSTSANPTGSGFDPVWAREVAEIVVERPEGFSPTPPSPIYRLGKKRLRRLR